MEMKYNPLEKRREMKDSFQELSKQHKLLYTYVQAHPEDTEMQQELIDVKQKMRIARALLG